MINRRPLSLIAHCIVLFVFCLVTLAFAEAQSATATLSGTVQDQNGAIIPGAAVTVINVGTGARRQTTTSDSGSFTIPLLQPSTYKLRVEQTGFSPIEVSEVVLNVGDQKALQIQLKAGDVNATVQVTSEASLISESPAVATVVDRQFVENMPLNGRSFQALIALTPGVVATPSSLSSGNLGQFSVNGQRADANYFTVDGVSANVGMTASTVLGQTVGGTIPALSAQGGTNSLVSVDAMQEFRIQTSSFAPEFGRTPGGQISIVTRGGTNQFHGTASDYFRNDVLDANDWFANRNGLRKPQERQNDFGGVLGGPIIKNKLFFFFSYEGLRLRQPRTSQNVVPSLASRQAAPPQIQPFLNAYPLPNGAALSGGFAQFNASFSNPSSLDAYSIRADHTLNSKIQLFGRYSYSPSEVSSRGNGTGIFSTNLRTVTFGLTHTITSKVINEVRANYSSQTATNRFRTDNFGGAVPLSDTQLGFPSGFSTDNSEFLFALTGAGSIVQGTTAHNEQRQINVVDNLSLTLGAHQLKFGADYRRLSPISGPLAYFLEPVFSGITGPTGTSSGVAQFVVVQASQRALLLSQNFSLYGQDNWKVTPRLTLVYGLRWDVNPALKGRNGNSDPFTVQRLENPATMTLAPRGTPLYQTTYGNFAPRLGVAYQLRREIGWETVVRGNVGVFYDLGSGYPAGATLTAFPYTATNIFSNLAFPLTSQQAVPPPFSQSPPVSSIFVAEPHLALPRSYQWNGAIEQSLGTDQVLSVTYVGALGRDLLRTDRLSNPNANFGSVAVVRNTATSNYNALQIKFQRRLSNGLQALGSYTWSHSIDIASSDSATFNTPAAVGTALDRGNSDFDVRHSISAAVTYEIPVRKLSGIARTIFGGWSLHNLVTARSALPVNVLGPTFTVAGTQYQARPNVVQGIPLYLYGSQYPGGKAINFTPNQGGTACKGPFCPPPTGTQGSLGRNVLRGFGVWQDDFAVHRQFRLTEKLRLQFRTEFFNVFNHPNFGAPTNTFTSALFGQSTQTLASSLGSGGLGGGFNPLYQVGGPRSIQFALKLDF
jgi:hypothetical protein